MCKCLYTGKVYQSCTDDVKEGYWEVLIEFTNDVGIPDLLVTNGVTKFTGKGTEFGKEACCMCIHLHTTEQGQKNQNHAAEREIGMLAKCWKLHMAK